MYEEVRQFSEGLAAVKAKGKWGYIDRRGMMIIAPQFVEADEFRNDFAMVRLLGGRRAIINRIGNLVPMPRQAQAIGRPSQGLIAVKIAGRWGFINTQGKMVIRQRYEPDVNDYNDDEYGGEFSEGLAAVKWKGKWGFVNRRGRLVIAAQFEKAEPFQGEVAIVEQNYQWGLIDRKGHFIIAPEFDVFYGFTEGLAAVVKDGKSGFVDRQGRWRIPATFERAGSFSEGLAAVRVGGKWGYIDRTGKIVIAAQLASEGYFRNGLAWQAIEGSHAAASRESQTVWPQGNWAGWGYIDRTGRFVWKSAMTEQQ
jgi:hypothetical protein